MKNEVLIATYYWPPSGGAGVQRFLKFVKYLPQFGVQPTVLTVENPTYPIIDESLGNEVPESVGVHRTRSIEPFDIYAMITGKSKQEIAKPTIHLTAPDWKSKLGSWVRANIFVPDARIGWVPSARKKALELVRATNISSIITTGPPHSTHFIGTYLKKKTDIRWIADLRDPWSKIYYNQVMPRTELARKLDVRMEKNVLRSADEVIVVSSSMEAQFRALVDRKYHTISNGFDPEDFEMASNQETSKNEVFTIRFVGSVREAAIPTGLFQALGSLPKDLNYRLEYIGNVHPQVGELIEQHGLQDKVFTKSYVPHAEAIRYMKEADLLLLSISKTENSEQILTGKLFDYLGAGNPILFIGTTKGDAAAVIREINQGYCYEHDDVNGLQRFLEDTLRNPSRLDEINDNLDMTGHPYSRITQTKQLASII